MKFKYLIIAFSVIIVLILIAAALFLFVLADSPLAGALLPEALIADNFFAKTLPGLEMQYIVFAIFVFMLIVLLCLGIFLLSNYRMLSLLEREDWPALAYYLEQKIFVKGRYNARKVKLLASSYMVISDYPSVLKLEAKAALAKPSVVEKNILIFGSARVLSGRPAESMAFFKTYIDKDKVNPKEKEWVRWFYCFSQLLGGYFNQTEPEFISMANFSRDALITGLSAYFLSGTLVKHSQRPEKCSAAAEIGKNRVIGALKNKGGWKREVERMAAEIHIAIIRKYIDETGIWLFEQKKPAPIIAETSSPKKPKKAKDQPESKGLGDDL